MYYRNNYYKYIYYLFINTNTINIPNTIYGAEPLLLMLDVGISLLTSSCYYYIVCIRIMTNFVCGLTIIEYSVLLKHFFPVRLHWYC